MSVCKAVLKVLNTKETSTLPQKELEELERHLAGCSSCRAHQKYLRLTSAVLQDFEIPEVSTQLAKRILAETEQLPQVAPWREYWSQSRWFPVAAAAAFAMSVLLVFGSLSMPIQHHPSSTLVKKRFALLHGPSLKPDEISMAAGALGLEIE